MTIWILAILLLASLAGLGYRQGAVRVAFSLVGILFGALLAVPLGHLIRPAFSGLIKNPVVLWFLPPFIVFVLILTIFKIGALAMHKKIEMHFKYKVGDVRFKLWERMIRRTGLCLGLVNGLAYLILISYVIYVFGYWTVQIAGGESESWTVKLFNRLAVDLESSGMAKAARSIESLPTAYYDTADIVGTIYHTPQLETRLANYPAYLSLAERPEFQALASDASFTDLRRKQSAMMTILDHPSAQAIVKNPDLLKAIWAATLPNLQDLGYFLTNGVSPKFEGEKILGRWRFDLQNSVALLRRTKTTLTAAQLAQTRNWMAANLTKATLVATTDQQVFLKNVPRLRAATAGGAAQAETVMGQWSGSDGKYELTFNRDGRNEQVSPEVQNDRLGVVWDGIALAFVRDN